MAEPLPIDFPPGWETPTPPDVSHLTTENDTPVESVYQDKQCDILTEALRVSWLKGRPFVSGSDVAIFPIATDEAAIVPEVMLSVGVEPPGPSNLKEFRSYFVWNYGKPPDIVIEIVSNKTGGEDTLKLERYAKIRVRYYVIYDPEQQLSARPLRLFQLTGMTYADKVDRSFPEVGLGLTVWFGEFDGFQEHWLRWTDTEGNLLAIGEEEGQRAEREQARAEREQARAEQAEAIAEAERERASQAESEAERLRQKLREAGIDPDS